VIAGGILANTRTRDTGVVAAQAVAVARALLVEASKKQ
jgi:hypothetical protein